MKQTFPHLADTLCTQKARAYLDGCCGLELPCDLRYRPEIRRGLARRFPDRTKPTPAQGLPTLTRTRPSARLSGLDGPLSGYPGGVGGAATLGELGE
jgi:hypothetical protein